MESNQLPKGLKWTSYILQGILVALFLMGGIMNMSGSEEAVKGATEIGYPASTVFTLGLVLTLCAILYAVPRTTIIGAILLTGWLGGAVATHVIHEDPTFNTLMPIIFGVLIWLAIGLRNRKLLEAM